MTTVTFSDLEKVIVYLCDMPYSFPNHDLFISSTRFNAKDTGSGVNDSFSLRHAHDAALPGNKHVIEFGLIIVCFLTLGYFYSIAPVEAVNNTYTECEVQHWYYVLIV